jgi:hypothetical protein
VESFVVDHLPVVPQQPHDDLKMVARVDVLCHDVVICAVEQNLAQQLDRLALCDIALRLYQYRIVLDEEHIEVGL